MTAYHIELEHQKISYLVASGVALQVAESLFPHPFPGVRLGLANISTLLALNFYSFSVGVYVAFMRPFISSLFLGSFLSPAFILSLSASLLSCFVMWIFLFTKTIFSNIGISIFGAITHNITQLTVAYLLFVRHQGVFFFLPVLLLSAVITGSFTGWCVNYITEQLKDKKFLSSAVEFNIPLQIQNNIPYKVVLKIFYCIVITIFAFIVSRLKFLILVFLLSISSILLFRVNIKRFFSRLYILWLLIFSAIFFHLFFTPGKEIFSISIIKVTYQGLSNAASAVIRICSVLFVSTALMLSTTNTELIAILTKVSKLFRSRSYLISKIPETTLLAVNYYFSFILQKIQQIIPKTPKKILEILFL